LIALEAISPVILASPTEETSRDDWGRSPPSAMISSVTCLAAIGEPSAVTKPTLAKSPLFQPDRKSCRVSSGPSLPHAARPPPSSTTTDRVAAARVTALKRPRAGCGERRMSSPSRGTS
jgi:hypothetical protein